MLDLDPTARDTSKRRGGGVRRPTAAADGERRRGAVTSPANSISSSRPRFRALNASTRRAQAGEASRDNGRGGVAAERRVDAAAQLGAAVDSGETSRAVQSTTTSTSGAVALLTSLRDTGRAP
jgi:hypothetical protein